ncbi:MAG: type III pantothenate kinase [Oscillospiraceae bacterium]|nr:type III pantothenate kinase [Oscillospiraceae bacterium]
MLLTVDVGNTNTEFSLFAGDELTHTFRIMTKANQTSDEIGLTVCEYFHRFGLNLDEVEDVIISSVVPEIMYSLKNAMVKYLGRQPLVVNEDVFPTLGYLGDLSALDGRGSIAHGADRSVACMAAVELYGAPVLVLDFGTATTLDAVRSDNVYIGGSICTGLRTTMEALAANASMLPTIELKAPDTFLGYDIPAHLRAGVVGGYIGGIEYLIRRTKAEMPEPDDQIRVVATGGLSRMIAENTDAIDVVNPELIPEGLLRIYRKYRASHAPSGGTAEEAAT